VSGFTQLRIELPDHPGALAAVTRVLAQHGMNVVEVSIHEVDGAHAVDEIVVQSQEPVSDLVLRTALARAGAGLLSSAACPMRTDPVVAALTWVCAALDHPDRRSAVTTGVAVLSGIAPIHVLSPAEALEYPIGAAALRRGAPVVQRLDRVPDVVRGDGGEGGRWVLAAPDGPEAELVVLAARPYAIRFTATEVRRLVAVLECRRRLRSAVHPAQDERATWSRALASNA
jgi:predicted amino acid-binding ACT domain protein